LAGSNLAGVFDFKTFGNDVEKSSFADGIWGPAGNPKVPEYQLNHDPLIIKSIPFLHGEFW
jgi:hypothetical protein